MAELPFVQLQHLPLKFIYSRAWPGAERLRDDLAALAQRLPPQERDAFRRELLAVPDGRRRAWLQQRRER